MSECQPTKTDRLDGLFPGTGSKKHRHCRPEIVLTVAMGRQTPEEERRFEAAFDLLVSEMVRQELGRRG